MRLSILLGLSLALLTAADDVLYFCNDDESEFESDKCIEVPLIENECFLIPDS